MKTLIPMLMLVFSALTYAEELKLPWADKCVRVVTLGPDLKLVNSYSQYKWFGGSWGEVEAEMGILMNRPNLQISLEYLNYRAGNHVTNVAEYAADCNAFPTNENDDPEVKELSDKSEAGTLTLNDFKGPKWLHMIQPIDTEEANCLAISKKNGVLAGCADIWQDGITNEEVVCFEGKTYSKCHMNCMNKIYNRKLDLTNGFCPADGGTK